MTTVAIGPANLVTNLAIMARPARDSQMQLNAKVVNGPGNTPTDRRYVDRSNISETSAKVPSVKMVARVFNAKSRGKHQVDKIGNKYAVFVVLCPEPCPRHRAMQRLVHQRYDSPLIIVNQVDAKLVQEHEIEECGNDYCQNGCSESTLRSKMASGKQSGRAECSTRWSEMTQDVSHVISKGHRNHHGRPRNPMVSFVG